MNINIFGSTGVIGKKTLDLVDKNFPHYKINLLCAKSNYKLLKKQINKYNPKYAFLYNTLAFQKYNGKINNTKILNLNELFSYLSSSQSNFSVLAISGYKSLDFLEQIINNTDNLGIASKEAIVSAGHIFKKKKYFTKTNIFPLDSEHFSLFEFLKGSQRKDSIKKIIVTASGGPFYKKKFKNLSNIKFSEAINHPKWKMGYKNSIDSATLVNKCLEVIEAHYLFDIPFNKIEVLIHPEAIVHSAIEYNNFVTQLNLFKNEMKIPLFNFFSNPKLKTNKINEKYDLHKFSSLNFEKVKKEIFPIYSFFKRIDKTKPQNIIKFNIGNEYAVNLYKNKIIKYTDIYKIIKKVTSLNLYSPVNNIKDIIKYHEKIEKKLYYLDISNL
tara:strand:+ start:760 stop:1911 length:1152 start_codon:yes stop_codon:yes gene_type:complete